MLNRGLKLGFGIGTGRPRLGGGGYDTHLRESALHPFARPSVAPQTVRPDGYCRRLPASAGEPLEQVSHHRLLHSAGLVGNDELLDTERLAEIDRPNAVLFYLIQTEGM